MGGYRSPFDGRTPEQIEADELQKRLQQLAQDTEYNAREREARSQGQSYFEIPHAYGTEFADVRPVTPKPQDIPLGIEGYSQQPVPKPTPVPQQNQPQPKALSNPSSTGGAGSGAEEGNNYNPGDSSKSLRVPYYLERQGDPDAPAPVPAPPSAPPPAPTSYGDTPASHQFKIFKDASGRIVGATNYDSGLGQEIQSRADTPDPLNRIQSAAQAIQDRELDHLRGGGPEIQRFAPTASGAALDRIRGPISSYTQDMSKSGLPVSIMPIITDEGRAADRIEGYQRDTAVNEAQARLRLSQEILADPLYVQRRVAEFKSMGGIQEAEIKGLYDIATAKAKAWAEADSKFAMDSASRQAFQQEADALLAPYLGPEKAKLDKVLTIPGLTPAQKAAAIAEFEKQTNVIRATHQGELDQLMAKHKMLSMRNTNSVISIPANQ